MKINAHKFDGWVRLLLVVAVAASFLSISKQVVSAETVTDATFIKNGSGAPEIKALGNWITILSGDVTPSLSDGTDFGAVDVANGTMATWFQIQNTGTADLYLTGTPFVEISGAHASDFTVTEQPPNVIAPGVTGFGFVITFDPGEYGLRTATISIANNDSDENPYTFTVQGTGADGSPEIDVYSQGKGSYSLSLLTNGDTSPDMADGTDFGNVDIDNGSYRAYFRINNYGNENLDLTGTSPVEIGGPDALDFAVATPPPSVLGIPGAEYFEIVFDPSSEGIRIATITIANNDPDEDPYTFTIQGTGITGGVAEMSVHAWWLHDNSIADGDTSPSSSDATDFGNGRAVNFCIKNTGSANLILTGNPAVEISGLHAADVGVTTSLNSGAVVSPGSGDCHAGFGIYFNPGGMGLRTATVSIANDTATTNPYDFAIQSIGLGVDPYEDDDDFSTAGIILPNTPQTRSIFPAGDHDYVKFTLASPSSIVLETSGLTGYDTEMALYDAGHNLIGYDNDGGDFLYSRVERTCSNLLPAGEYYAMIYIYDGILPEYHLTFNTEPCLPTEIPQAEYEALLALYNSTDGVHWTNHTNWLQTNTPCSWYGIHCAGGHVTEITLHGNNLSGSIPTQLGNLSYLTGLWLYDNQLTGSIPPELGNLTNLTELALYINQLSGPIPLELGNLTKLEWLNLSRNQLTGSIPSAFGDLTQLQGLYLFRNQLTGPIPAGLGNLVNLTELYLNENQLSGSIPPQLGNMGKLERLNLGVNQLSGPIPSGLGDLAQLQYLNLYHNQLDGSIPLQIGNLSNLSVLWLSVNQLSGPIPPELGNLTNLTQLGLAVNQLNGSIPIELGNLSNLNILNLYSNQLTGSIPTELGNLVNLTGLELSKNQLSGYIPIELANLTNLTYLFLYNNQLSGPIPFELGNLTNLQRLTLHNNHLSGEFPTSITNLVNLTMLTFDCWITSRDPAVIAFIENLAPGWQNNACPSLGLPLDDATLDNGRFDRRDNIVWDFDWSDVPNAAKYHLYVIHNGASIPLIDDDEITEGSSYHYTGAGAYVDSANLLDWTWMVRAYINGAWGEWSEIRTFNVEPLDTDPPLQFANTFVGGTGNDAGNAIAVDADGNMYIAGASNAAWGAPIQAHNGSMDAFVARLDSNGNLVWNTFLGGAGDDWGSSIAIDASGNVYLAGGSDAAWGSPLRAHAGDSDAFAAKLDSSGHLVWNTFLGGSGYDEGFLTLDNSGNILVAGGSSSTWGTPLHAYNGYGDAFAARLNPSGGLVWNTFLGGAGGDEAWNLTTDGSNLYLTGYSDQTWGTPVRAYSGGFSDAFAAKLDASGAVLWNTFLGGAEHDEADGIAVAPNGNVYVSGFSDEGLGGTATWGNPVRPFSGERDAFAAGLAPSGALLWNTFLGGAGGDGSNSIAVGKDGSIFVVGGASGSWGNPMSAFAGTYDGFVARLSSSGILTGSTFLGGSNLDTANDIALDPKGRAFIAGYSASEWGKPITGYAGGSRDAFVAKVDLSTTFTDVPASYWAWSFIQRLANAGVTGGCSANPVMYCPESPVNRAQMAVFLLRGKHGSAYSPPAASGTVFRDVPATHWAAAWIEQLQAEGITSGCGNGNYCPDTAVTRDQMAVFLLRAKYGSSYAPPAASGNFIDVPTNYWAAAWIEQLAKEGITTGCGGGSYCPVAVTNRAQMAVFLVKAFGLP